MRVRERGQKLVKSLVLPEWDRLEFFLTPRFVLKVAILNCSTSCSSRLLTPIKVKNFCVCSVWKLKCKRELGDISSSPENNNRRMAALTKSAITERSHWLF